jgi:hypothetical protein
LGSYHSVRSKITALLFIYLSVQMRSDLLLPLAITFRLVNAVAFFHHDFNSFDRQLCLPAC